MRVCEQPREEDDNVSKIYERREKSGDKEEMKGRAKKIGTYDIDII